MNGSGLPPIKLMIIRIYHLISGGFGVAYGIYSIYVFYYLNALLKVGPDSAQSNPLDSLLMVLALSMLFEVIAEPATGNFADSKGRRAAVVWAFSLMAGAYLCYGAISLFSLQGKSSIVAIAIVSEVLLAVGLAFHSGALDAWFVDALMDSKDGADKLQSHNNEAVDSQFEDLLQYHFARNGQCFAIGVLLGGLAGLIFGFNSFDGVNKTAPVVPWLMASGVTVAVALFSWAAMIENRAQFERMQGPGIGRGVVMRLSDTLRTPGVAKLSLTISSVYLCAMIALYFCPMVFNEKMISIYGAVDESDLSNRGSFLNLLLGLIPFILTMPRIVGPSLALAISKYIKQDCWRLRTLGLLASFLFVAVGFLISQKESRLAAMGVVFLLIASWTCAQAARTVANANINVLIVDSSIRTFAMSVSTVLGAFLVSIIALVLISLESIFGLTQNASVDYLKYVLWFAGIMSAGGVLVGTKKQRS